MSRTARPLVIATAFAASLVVGLLVMFWAMGGVSKVAQPAAIGGPFALTDQNGKTVTDKSLKGKPTLIFFGYTHCPDVCPTSLFEISEVLRAMGKDADKVNAYFISVDPERDTPATMKDYLSSFDPHLEALPLGDLDAQRQRSSGLGEVDRADEQSHRRQVVGEAGAGLSRHQEFHRIPSSDPGKTPPVCLTRHRLILR